MKETPASSKRLNFNEEKIREAVAKKIPSELNISQLRQWLNEDRITDKKQVTNKEIKIMLGIVKI